jgi:hypothetical protein
MNSLYAMRRANGDWFAIDDNGGFRVPVFHSNGAAMVARSRDASMECFRPVRLDDSAFKDLRTTDEGKARFWLVADPLLGLNRGSAFNAQQLAQFMASHQMTPVLTKDSK